MLSASTVSTGPWKNNVTFTCSTKRYQRTLGCEIETLTKRLGQHSL